MTPDERKRGLRAEVEAMVTANREQAWSMPAGITYSAYDYHVAQLWKIIDSLVDECDERGASILGAASDCGIYDGDDPDSALDCLRLEIEGFHKMMWRIERLLNCGSARADDIEAAIKERLCDGSAVRPADSPEAIAKAAERAGQPYDAMTEGGE